MEMEMDEGVWHDWAMNLHALGRGITDEAMEFEKARGAAGTSGGGRAST